MSLITNVGKELGRKDYIDKQLYLNPSLVFSYQNVSNFVFVAVRGIGKSVISVETAIILARKYGYENVKCYYFRLTDLSCKTMLANKGAKAVDPYLVDKYNMEITTKGNVIYDHGKKFIEFYPLVSAGSKGKGAAHYDTNFLNKRPIDPRTGKPIKRFIVTIWDEFLFAGSGVEKKSVGDPVAQYRIYMEAITRDQKRIKEYNAVYNFFLANACSECAPVTGALFNYIPEPSNHRITKLTRKHAIFWNVPVTKAYIDKRKESYNADIMDYENDPNYTNVVMRDMELIKPKKTRLVRLTQIIKFDANDPQKWFSVYDDKYIRLYKNESFSKSIVVSMVRHLDELFITELVQGVLLRYDTRGYMYSDIMSQELFKAQMRLIKAK